jgi:hypothetical protein
MYLSYSLIAIGAFREAEREFARSAREAPDEPATWMGLAEARLSISDRDGAAEATHSFIECTRAGGWISLKAPILLFRAHRYRKAYALTRDPGLSLRNPWRLRLLRWILPIASRTPKTHFVWLIGLALFSEWLFIAPFYGRVSWLPIAVFIVMTLLFILSMLASGSSRAIRFAHRAARAKDTLPAADIERPWFLTEPASSEEASSTAFNQGMFVRTFSSRRLPLVAAVIALVFGMVAINGSFRHKSYPESPLDALKKALEQNKPSQVMELTMTVSTPDCLSWAFEGASVTVSGGGSTFAPPIQPRFSGASNGSCSLEFSLEVPREPTYVIRVGPRFSVPIELGSDTNAAAFERSGNLSYDVTVEPYLK